jgi:hypothetical protein
MDQHLSSLNELLEWRLALMRELANSLERAQATVLNSDPGQISAQTMRQRELCEELRRLASALTPQQVPSPAQAEDCIPGSYLSVTAELSAARARRKTLLVELADVERRVAHLNRAYGALLQRARRTVDIFCRVLVNSGVTYVPPQAQPAPAMQNSRG